MACCSHHCHDGSESNRCEYLAWNMQDAREALECAVSLQDWNGVIKYASQLKEMEALSIRLQGKH